jgi:myo-inositol 2-dehydrogenase/D-chiro-inositol 1-dehydrogenase
VTPVRIACIGCGFIGRRHLENAVAMDGVRVAAHADLNPAAAEVFQRDFGGVYATADPQRIFEDPEIDAVIIATHHDSHTPLALAAAAAGKHILIEKPMALTVDECRRIAAAAEKAGVVLTVNFKFRMAPAVLAAKRFIPRPVATFGQLAMNRMPDGIWVRDPARGGGLILATACHVLDMIYWLNESEPVRVYAEGEDDAAAATVRFANGAIASLLLSDVAENPYVGKWLHEIFDGRNSAVLYDHFRQVRFGGPGASGCPDFTPADEPHADGTYGILEDFVCAIRTGRKPAITARDGIRATLLAVKVHEALRTGQPREVRLDGDD